MISSRILRTLRSTLFPYTTLFRSMVAAIAQSPDQRNATAEQVLRDHRSEEHTSELQSPMYLVCRLLLEKKKALRRRDRRRRATDSAGPPATSLRITQPADR